MPKSNKKKSNESNLILKIKVQNISQETKNKIQKSRKQEKLKQLKKLQKRYEQISAKLEKLKVTLTINELEKKVEDCQKTLDDKISDKKKELWLENSLEPFKEINNASPSKKIDLMELSLLLNDDEDVNIERDLLNDEELENINAENQEIFGFNQGKSALIFGEANLEEVAEKLYFGMT